MNAHSFARGGREANATVFRTAMAELPGGVNAITCLGKGEEPLGATISAVSSLSLDPPMILACFDSQSKTLDALKVNGTMFLVHILADGQENIACALASKRPDKFEEFEWNPGYSSLPQINGAAVVIACSVSDCVRAGDHVIVTGTVQEITHNPKKMALLYYRSSIFPISTMKDLNL